MRLFVPTAILLSAMPAIPAIAAPVSLTGKARLPNTKYNTPAAYQLTDNFQFNIVSPAQLKGVLDLHGHTLTVNTGGGNATTFAVTIAGTGNVIWKGGGSAHFQTVPSFLAGDQPNTYHGTLTLTRGMLALAKPAGVTAVTGDIILGGGNNQAILRLDRPNQISDHANLLMRGKHEGRLQTQGHSETLGTLTLQSQGYIDLGDQSCTLAFADSSRAKWDLTKTLTIRHWTRGKDTLRFGTDSHGLTPEQLARIGFDDPSGFPPGLYAAKMLDDGSLTPDRQVHAVNPPFDLSAKARTERAKLYDVQGLEHLTGPHTPLKDGMVIDCFGDSITWLNSYITRINKAIKAGPGTKNLRVKLVNRGVNGGGVLQILNGASKAAYPGNSAQKPFAQQIVADKADLATVYIGVNDVWWRKTTPEVFEQSLRKIVAAAEAHHVTLVLVTLSVHGELPNGKNHDDAKIERFAQITRDVAASTGTTLVDLRKAYIAYERNHNAELRVDGSLHSVATGILTHDGVHPTAKGARLLANLIAQGIDDALSK